MPVLPDLMQLVALMKEEGPAGDEDLMKADGDAKPPMGDKSKDKPAPVAPEKGPEVVDGKSDQPVKFDSAMGSSTNGCIPSNTKKEAYNMNDADKVKYKKEVEVEVAAKYKADLDAVKKVNDQLLKESRLLKAKEMVTDLEETFMIQYASDAVRNEDIDMLSKLEPSAAKQYVEMAKVRYAKKLPNSAAVAEVAKYAVEGEPDLQSKTPEEAHERAMKIVKSGLSVEEFYKQLAAGKTK